MFCPDCGGRKMIKKRAEVSLQPACLVNYKAATHPESGQKNGGRTQNRTGDTGIFSPLLYRLSYPATLKRQHLSF